MATDLRGAERPAGSVRWVTTRLLVVGGGKMGSALLIGLINAGWAPVEELAVCDPDPARRKSLSDAHPGLTVADLPMPADGAVLAVKPDVAEAVLRILGAVGITRVLSIVAGLSSARLEAALGPDDVVVRAMPNTPALIGAGVAGLSGGSRATAADLDWAEGILGLGGHGDQASRAPPRRRHRSLRGRGRRTSSW